MKRRALVAVGQLFSGLFLAACMAPSEPVHVSQLTLQPADAAISHGGDPGESSRL